MHQADALLARNCPFEQPLQHRRGHEVCGPEGDLLFLLDPVLYFGVGLLLFGLTV